MRKYQQAMVLELIDTLDEVCREVKKIITEGNHAAVKELLIGGDEFSEKIQEHIASIKGQDTKTAAIIDEFRALIYDLYEAIESGGSVSGGFIKALPKSVTKIRRSVHSELMPDKLEIVFLPYKASMFDCFETIWLAAKNDPIFDVYVVPIPYYDLLPGGIFGKMHYEGDQYPPNVPITDWREYKIEERKPDVIFIHNPYDDLNLVTRVHPSFYASRLHKFTDMLAYVPYFISPNNIIKDFVITPGTIYADRVFLESEKIRETYISVYKDWSVESGINRQHELWGKIADPKEKFVALGSPKTDKAAGSNRNDYDLPDEWRAVLGGGKKTILLNTRLTDMRAGIEKQLHKLRSTLEYFKNNKNVLLWWRPHPLNLPCLQAMRPHLAGEYQKIVNEYKNSGWGVYDDTSDLHRAIALTDAYYGDMSSLIPLYKTVGKPALIQHVDAEEKIQKTLSFYDFYDDGESLWASEFYYNALFKINKKTWESEYMGSFPGEPASKGELYISVCEVNKKLYFVPYTAVSIGVYDLKSREFSNIPFKIPGNLTKKRFFYYSVPFKNGIYFIPVFYPSIMFYDIEKNEIKYFDYGLEQMKKLGANPEAYPFTAIPVSDSSKFILPCAVIDAIMEFDMLTGKSTTYFGKSNNNLNMYFTITHTDGKYWLTRSSGDIEIISDIEKPEDHETITMPKSKETEGAEYGFIICVGEYIWVFPQVGFNAYKIHRKTKEITELPHISDEAQIVNENIGFVTWASYTIVKENKETVLALGAKSRQMFEFSAEGEIIRKKPITVPDEIYHGIIKDIFVEQTSEKSYLKESFAFRLDDFIEILMKNTKIETSRTSSGKNIFNYIKKIISK